MYLEFFDIRHAMTAAKLLHTNAIFKAVSAKVQFCPKSALEQVQFMSWLGEGQLGAVAAASSLTNLKYALY